MKAAIEKGYRGKINISALAGGSNTGLTSASEQSPDQESNRDRVQGRFPSPASQAVKRCTRLSACFDSIGDGLSGFPDRLSSRLNGLLGLVELAWAIGILQRLTLADHLSSPGDSSEDRRPEQIIVPSSFFVTRNRVFELALLSIGLETECGRSGLYGGFRLRGPLRKPGGLGLWAAVHYGIAGLVHYGELSMIRTLLLGVAVVIATADGAATQTKDAATIYGFATVSCGYWQQHRTAKNAGSLQLEAYIDGFLSGYNMASIGSDFLAGTPNDKGVSFHIWIDKYCRDKPLDMLSQAVIALKDELLARAR